jgi:TatD DNase family protein
MSFWIDTHCHLDAPEFSEGFGPLAGEISAGAAINNVALCVLPAVKVSHFSAVQQLAHAHRYAYALGIHPLYVPHIQPDDLQRVDEALHAARDDARLVAVGEIGLDYFVPQFKTEPLASQQEQLYRAQLKLARQHGLPVILHVRRSADRLLKHLREVQVCGGIAHAFNGSVQQAQEFISRGFKLGFGGAVTFERATQLRELARSLPLSALVMETDAPDMPPHWLYTTAEQRAAGAQQPPNTPAQLPRIAQVVADLRGIPVDELQAATTRNAIAALPKLASLL